MSDAIVKALDGLIDMHVHSGPSPFPRRVLHYEAAQDGWDRLRMRAMVVKSHHHNTVMDVLAQAHHLAAIPTEVFGGIALNSTVGGVNPFAVRMSLNMGGRVVWFPTISSGRHIDCHPEGGKFPTASISVPVERIDVVAEDGELVAAAREVLHLVHEAGAVLNAGHMYPEQIRALFTEAHARGMDRMVISHPNFVIGADPALCDEFIALGAHVEHEVGMYNPDREDRHFEPDVLMEWISRHGPEHIVLASDMGQRNNPLPVDAWLGTCGALLDLGLPESDLRQMAVHNPATLLGLTG
ncbi:DUF6282 family protein [Modestobacter sp. VKM Ac-2978]|uniref:DUF6282 family protein n=1 Tax=Modestobacter sp. VKM Ac-2978 TaxID=3004132 RepID=UPI0022AAE041|nr:DUF6282 family protein [Modestobacter sp. VKM Ac-2978]MCZ2847810.1 DUF6282 family protein [Modestobacter sp. VKM Ac-2978]